MIEDDENCDNNDKFEVVRMQIDDRYRCRRSAGVCARTGEGVVILKGTTFTIYNYLGTYTLPRKLSALNGGSGSFCTSKLSNKNKNKIVKDNVKVKDNGNDNI